MRNEFLILRVEGDDASSLAPLAIVVECKWGDCRSATGSVDSTCENKGGKEGRKEGKEANLVWLHLAAATARRAQEARRMGALCRRGRFLHRFNDVGGISARLQKGKK